MARRVFDGRLGLITGCSSGIGRELALLLAQRGADLIVTARREQALVSLVEEIQRKETNVAVTIVAGDITQESTQRQLFELIQNGKGSLDFLINNAGVGAFGPFQELESEAIRRLIEVDVLAPFETTRLLLPLLAKGRDPLVVNMGSVLGYFPVPLKSVYCAAKYAIRGWSESARMEFRRSGIDVLHVAPSTTESEFFQSTIQDKTNINWTRFGAMKPGDVAAKVVRAMEKGTQELVLTGGGKFLSLAHRLFPRATRMLLKKDAKHVPALKRSSTEL